MAAGDPIEDSAGAAMKAATAELFAASISAPSAAYVSCQIAMRYQYPSTVTK
jgi:hypothetical protein